MFDVRCSRFSEETVSPGLTAEPGIDRANFQSEVRIFFQIWMRLNGDVSYYCIAGLRTSENTTFL